MQEPVTTQPFRHVPGFERGVAHEAVPGGKFESEYEEIFAEVIEDGVITTEERARLERVAANFGIDRERVERIERALRAAYEARHQVKIFDERMVPSLREDDDAPPPSIVIGAASLTELQRENAALKERLAKLERELERAKKGTVPPPSPEDDPAELHRRIRRDPTDPEPMHLLYRAAERVGDVDRKWCVASALVFLGQADDQERATFAEHRANRLPAPRASVSNELWRKCLLHPEEDLLTSDVLALVTKAALLGRIAALRRDRALPTLADDRRQEVGTSTVQAVRAIGWSAAILGLRAPIVHVEPDLDIELELVPALPPRVRLGGGLLRDRSVQEVAFVCGRMLAGFREEHFVRWLFSGVTELEELFLAALTIAHPALPIPRSTHERVAPIAAAIAPILEPETVDRLRALYARFVEDGGRTNLRRWANAVDMTACRAGLLLSGDLPTAAALVERTPGWDHGKRVAASRDLVAFVTGERYATLRKQLGIAIEPAT